MNDRIHKQECAPTSEGLRKIAIAYFDLREAAEGKNLRQLLLNSITKDVADVGVAWQATIFRPRITDKLVSPPSYLGDRIALYWSRPITTTEALADLEQESDNDIDSAVNALVAAGYHLMEYPE